MDNKAGLHPRLRSFLARASSDADQLIDPCDPGPSRRALERELAELDVEAPDLWRVSDTLLDTGRRVRVYEPGPGAGDVEHVLGAECQARERAGLRTLQRHVVVAAEGSDRVVERQVRHRQCPGHRSSAGSRRNVTCPRLMPIRGGDSSATAPCRSVLSITTRSADLPTSMP